MAKDIDLRRRLDKPHPSYGEQKLRCCGTCRWAEEYSDELHCTREVGDRDEGIFWTPIVMGHGLCEQWKEGGCERWLANG